MKKVLSATIVFAATAFLSGCSIFYPHWGETPSPSDSPSVTASASATPTESATPSATPKQPVSVDILQGDADAATALVTVIAQATGISEDGGVCTLTVTQGSTTKSISAKAESNVTDTQCFPLNLSIVGLAPGDASYTVTYNSDAYAGKSSPMTVVIP
jgi:hypothetical protein